MTSRNFTVSGCCAIHTLCQVAFSFVVWLEGELIIRLADAPTGGGFLGPVIAVALGATGCLTRYSMRPGSDRVLAQIPVLLAGAWTGCYPAVGIFWHPFASMLLRSG